MLLLVLARHAHSTSNVEGRVNGDPSAPVPLTRDGREQAHLLGLQLARLPLDLCVHTRFPRTRETARIALGDRPVPLIEEPLLDDVDVGELDGTPIAAYRQWKAEHRRSDPFPGGESLDAAARRYADAFEGLLRRPEQAILAVCHEIPIRYALNAAGGSDDLDRPVHEVPNAVPYLFGETELRAAAARILALAGEPTDRAGSSGCG